MPSSDFHGSCLCGDVAFAISGPVPDLYQCHCSLCRKVTGSAANAAFVVPAQNFRWLSGEATLRSYVRAGGYRIDFCPRCGSPCPNPMRDGTGVWVPAGLLDEAIASRVAAHIHVGSKAAWDEIGGNAPRHREGFGSDPA